MGDGGADGDGVALGAIVGDGEGVGDGVGNGGQPAVPVGSATTRGVAAPPRASMVSVL